jgi:hypothetical protein
MVLEDSSSSVTLTSSEDDDEDFSLSASWKKPAPKVATESKPKSHPPKKATLKKKKPISKRFSKANTKKSVAAAPEDFICEKCGEVFNSGWALGGHASRVHPGESEAYRNKIRRREERTFER